MQSTCLGRRGTAPANIDRFVAAAVTNAEVGEILKLSGRTVQKHLEHIYRKLGVETRTTATVRALNMLDVSNR